jgi:malate permease and related proteins
MTDELLGAYAPVFFWMGLGWLISRWLPLSFPRLMGRGLYWFGVPIEIFSLARTTDFSQDVGIAPLVTVSVLAAGFCLARLALWLMQGYYRYRELPVPDILTQPASQAGLIVASMTGNVGFIGLALVPPLVGPVYAGWAVFYSVTHNVTGTYGSGVLIASSYMRGQVGIGWRQLRDMVTVPSLWAFVVGFATRGIDVPPIVDSGLLQVVWVVIPLALLLSGLRLGHLQGFSRVRWAIVPMSIKSVLLPLMTGIVLTLAGVVGDARLSMVLMSGMPSAFAGLIIAEEYDLDRELIACSIALSTVALLVTVPVWIGLFG